MPDVDPLLERLRSPGRIVAATLVDVEGSSPLDVGATMLVGEDGSIEGSVTGGCVEGAVVEEAQGALRGAPAHVVAYGISDALAGTVGLTCGGTVHIFVHELRDADRATVAAVLEAVRAGRPAALATLLDGERAGAKLAVVDGEVVGALGAGALLERNVVADVRELLARGLTRIVHYGADGARAGDELRVHVHSHGAPAQLLAFGANDYSAELAPIARQLGFAVTICDAREPFMRSPRFAVAARRLVAWPDAAFAECPLGPRDAVVVLTHDPKFDEPAILGALASDVGYIGALGSRRTAADRTRRLLDAGATREQLARVHAPCGLDLGAATPAEAAVAILAEILAERSGRTGAPLSATSGAIRPARP